MRSPRALRTVHKVRRGLVMHAPSTVDKRELAVLDEPPRERLRRVALDAKPAPEEGNLRIDERSRSVFGERLDD